MGTIVSIGTAKINKYPTKFKIENETKLGLTPLNNSRPIVAENKTAATISIAKPRMICRRFNFLINFVSSTLTSQHL